MRKSIFVRSLGGYTLIVAVFAAALLGFSFRAVRKAYLEDQKTRLRNLAEVLTPRMTGLLSGAEPGGAEPFVRDLGGRLGVRITLIAADGRVLADSDEAPERMESHQYRPEIYQAMKGETATAVRPVRDAVPNEAWRARRKASAPVIASSMTGCASKGRREKGRAKYANASVARVLRPRSEISLTMK